MKRPILIGITGGTGSGKSTVSKEIFKSIHEKDLTIIEQDSYYKDQSELTYEERIKTNYDHPSAFDNELLKEHLKALLRNETIEKPIYDFENHTRSRTLNNYISHNEEIYNVSKELLESEELKSSLRLIGVSISSFKEREIEQMTLF